MTSHSLIMPFAILTTDVCRQAIADGIGAGKARLGDYIAGKIDDCKLYENGVQQSSHLFAVLTAANLDKATRNTFLDCIDAGLDAEERAALRAMDKFVWFVMNNPQTCRDAISESGMTDADVAIATEAFESVAEFGGDWWQWVCAVFHDGTAWPDADAEESAVLAEGGFAAIEAITALDAFASYTSGFERPL